MAEIATDPGEPRQEGTGDGDNRGADISSGDGGDLGGERVAAKIERPDRRYAGARGATSRRAAWRSAIALTASIHAGVALSDGTSTSSSPPAARH